MRDFLRPQEQTAFDPAGIAALALTAPEGAGDSPPESGECDYLEPAETATDQGLHLFTLQLDAAGELERAGRNRHHGVMTSSPGQGLLPGYLPAQDSTPEAPRPAEG